MTRGFPSPRIAFRSDARIFFVSGPNDGDTGKNRQASLANLLSYL
jgi:hypothetical protein